MTQKTVAPAALRGYRECPDVCGNLPARIVPLRIFHPPLLELSGFANSVDVKLVLFRLREKQNMLEHTSQLTFAGPWQGPSLVPDQRICELPSFCLSSLGHVKWERD